MAQDSSGGGNIPIAPIIALLLFVGGMLVEHQPLQSNRPISQPRALTVPHYGQDVEARLWQDPLEAVQAADREQEGNKNTGVRKDSGAACGDRGAKCHQPNFLKEQIKYLKKSKPGESILVLPVMIFGGPYADDSEGRRRNRYAVLSSLIDRGYEPIYSRGIGYLNIGNAKAQSPGLPNLIPFERWDRRADKAGAGLYDHVFVLWLTEETFTPGAHDNLQDLFAMVLPAKDITVKIIGPGSQATADDLWPADRKVPPCLKGKASVLVDCAEFLAPRLTTPTADPTAPVYSSNALRFSPDDRKLVTTLLYEFSNRDMKLLPKRGAPKCDDSKEELDHIAIVVEADTNYGRSLESEFFKALSTPECPPQNLHIFRYFRGLDGKTSHKVEESKKSSESAGLGSSKEKMAPQERTQGDSQFDYLLRIASRIRDQNDRLQSKNRRYWPFSLDHTGRSIRAVVVLGSDTHDKLAILHALRERLPQAVFATTDLDAGFLENDQLRWTRNLVVASGYDLRFFRRRTGGWEDANRGPPPFRDTYQTATFVATSQALMDAASNSNDASLKKSLKKLECAQSDALNNPRLVEIGDGLPVKLNPTGEREQEEDCKKFQDKRNHWLQIAVHVVTGLVAVLMFGLALSWCLRSVVREHWRALLAGAVLTAAYACYVVWISGQEGEEPLRWLDGVSIWPSEFIRLAVVILGVAFLFYERDHLNRGVACIAHEFFCLKQDSSPSPPKKALWVCIFPSWSESPGQDSVDVKVLWADYQKWISPTVFGLRLAIGTVLYALVALVLISQDPPITPARGADSLALDHVTVTAAFVVTSLVLVATLGRVAVSTLFLRRLFGNGADAKPSDWDEKTLRRFCGADCEEGKTFVDLMLSARMTEVVSDIVLYPFILSVLLLVARSRLFDNWVTPWGLMAVIAFGLTLVIIGALALRSSAERIRRYTIERLTNAQFGVRDGDSLKGGKSSELGPLLLRPPFTGPNKSEPCDPDKLRLMREVAVNLRRGAFAPLSEQPIVRALILPFGGAGVLSILEYLLMAKG